MKSVPLPGAHTIKSCCADLYQSDWAQLLLGDSFHPGGLALTEHLGILLGLKPGDRVLDVAAGKGGSAIFLAQHFACNVVGIDYGAQSVAAAVASADNAGISGAVTFRQGDAEALPFPSGEFDAVICECAFCTFPDKQAAAAEFTRVLRPRGRVGLSDFTCSGPLPPELQGLLAWISCLADAQPLDQYVAILASAGLRIAAAESHNEALQGMIHDIKGKLLGAELLVRLKKIDLPGADFDQARRLARSAAATVEAGKLGYTVIIGEKPAV